MAVSTAVWTAPITWTPDLPISKDKLNQLVGLGLAATGGNLNYLKDYVEYFRLTRPKAKIVRVASYTTTSTSFTDVDATNLKHTLTLDGAAVLCFVACYGTNSVAADGIAIDVIVNSTTRAGDATYGLFSNQAGTSGNLLTTLVGFALFTGLSAGSNDFKLQFKALTGGTSTINGSTNPITFVVMEL